MKRHLYLLSLLLFPLVGAPACVEDEPGDDDPYHGEIPPEDVFGLQWRGWGYGTSTVRLNTNIINGASINTVRFGMPTGYGQEIEWIFSPIHNEFLNMSTVKVVNGAIRGYTESGVYANTFSFDGSIWAIKIGGNLYAAVIEDVRYASEVGLANAGSKLMTNLDPNRVVYKWSSPNAPAAGTKVDPKTGWGGMYNGTNTCPSDNDGNVWTVMYKGLLVNEANGDVASADWAPDEYAYIACLNGRIGKTALWGYAPDNPSPSIPDLTIDEFEAAHRMVGAEYCGDGRSFTRPGEAVTIVDKWDINEHSADGVSDEAVWSVNGGALCVGTPRWETYAAPILCNNGTYIPHCNTVAPLYYGWLDESKWWTRNAFFPD